jgi:hypothetical protein
LEIWIYFMAIWNIFTDTMDLLLPFGTFVFIWYINSGFGIMYQEKSGNPAPHVADYIDCFRLVYTHV